MVKLLIKNKVNWLELPSKLEPDKTGYERNIGVIDRDTKLTDLQKEEKKLHLTRKNNAKEVIGDIIEVRRVDAKMIGLESDSFLLISVDGLDYKKAKEIYEVPVLYEPIEGFEKRIVKFTRKYNLNIAGIILNKEKEGALNLVEFQNRLEVKL